MVVKACITLGTGGQCYKTFCPYFKNFRNKPECLSMADWKSLQRTNTPAYD
jgi:hypothetical protein